MTQAKPPALLNKKERTRWTYLDRLRQATKARKLPGRRHQAIQAVKALQRAQARRRLAPQLPLQAVPIRQQTRRRKIRARQPTRTRRQTARRQWCFAARTASTRFQTRLIAARNRIALARMLEKAALRLVPARVASAWNSARRVASSWRAVRRILRRNWSGRSSHLSERTLFGEAVPQTSTPPLGEIFFISMELVGSIRTPAASQGM